MFSSHRAPRVLRVNKMNELLRLDRSKAPHRVRGRDALHRDRCEGFLGKKISSLILSLGAPSHKPLKRSYSVSSGPRVTLSKLVPVKAGIEGERARPPRLSGSRWRAGVRYPEHPVNPVQNSFPLGLCRPVRSAKAGERFLEIIKTENR
jgi:hypothetical protein